VERGQLRLVAAALVLREGAHPAVRLRLAAGHPARLRYDQFMRLGWKVLLPVNLMWILVLAGIKVMQSSATSAGSGS